MNETLLQRWLYLRTTRRRWKLYKNMIVTTDLDRCVGVVLYTTNKHKNKYILIQKNTIKIHVLVYFIWVSTRLLTVPLFWTRLSARRQCEVDMLIRLRYVRYNIVCRLEYLHGGSVRCILYVIKQKIHTRSSPNRQHGGMLSKMFIHQTSLYLSCFCLLPLTLAPTYVCLLRTTHNRRFINKAEIPV
jgi:hypothetical protein